MGRIVLIGLCLPFIQSAPALADGAERRCGWYSNPTSGNPMLSDGDGNWWIQMQGRPDPEGVDNAPAFDDKQFVETNVPGSGHGYGCACMTVVTNAKEGRITKIIAGKTVPLSRCRNDRSLPDPNGQQNRG
ncbi:DUF4087 domain-containing protein [Brucella intermedia]